MVHTRFSLWTALTPTLSALALALIGASKPESHAVTLASPVTVARPGHMTATAVAGKTEVLSLGNLTAGTLYGTTVSLPRLAGLGQGDAIRATVADAAGPVATKTLHAGDPDLYLTLKPRASGAATVSLTAAPAAGSRRYAVKIAAEPMPLDGKSAVLVEAQPHRTWREAQPIELGRTVFAADDDRPYIPPLGSAADTLTSMLQGQHWYTFTYAGPQPTTAHFVVDVLDRDVPVDVAIFTRAEKDGKVQMVPYTEGIERFVPEQSTPFHGLYKFIARVLKPGTYYLRVMGNHPAYQLRSDTYDPPPYTDPRQAIRIGMDYLVNKGDSWHANTPRRGGVVLRTTNPSQETSLCIACHPTHFTTRSELIAIENGYPVRQRQALQFLTERLYNNPRPLYGFPDAAWVRVISAPGIVESRLAYMLFRFEQLVSHEQRAGILEPLANYLAMYWPGVREPITESNGNLPRVSGFQVALLNGLLFDEMYRRSHDAKYRALRRQVEEVAARGKPIDMIDLCWKTVALATLDKAKYAPQLKALADEIFRYQKKDGTWSMEFGSKVYEYNYQTHTSTERAVPTDPDGSPKYSEFQTYHCIYALAKAGVTMADPRLAKSVRYCLSRQWPHGGWQGNPDFKNFDTPYRDTQFAIMALSELFKGPGSNGWMAGFPPPPKSIPASAGVDTILAALDQYWDDPGPAVRQPVRRLLRHPQPLIRQAAASCLGRLADTAATADLTAALGDDTKLVQRAAAWALRQIASRRAAGQDAILAALKSPDDRTRWGAARIFNQHFRFLAEDWPLAQALIDRLDRDPAVTVRMEACQALWKWWYWVKEADRKGAIEAAFIRHMAVAEHPWVRRNLIEGFGNIQDDNVAYFYNSWVAGIQRPEQKAQAVAGHHATVAAQARRIAGALSRGNDLQRQAILRSFYTFHLREANVDTTAVARVPLPETFQAAAPTRGANTWITGYRMAAVYDPQTMGTGGMAGIGNDHDPPTYYADSGPVIARGIAAVLDRGSGPLRAGALKALKNTRGVPIDRLLATRILKLAADAPARSSGDIRAVARALLPAQTPDTPEVRAALAQVLRRSPGGAIEVAASILALPRNHALAQHPEITGAVRDRLRETRPSDPDLAALLPAVANCTTLDDHREVAGRVLAIVRAGVPTARRAALRLLIVAPRFLTGSARKQFDAFVTTADAARFAELLQVATGIDLKQAGDEAIVQMLVGITVRGLRHPDPSVRRASLDAVRVLVPIQGNAAVQAAVHDLATDANPGVRESAAGLLASEGIQAGARRTKDLSQVLDFDFFANRVQPILQKPGADGNACVTCHASHAIFHLTAPDDSGQITPEAVRANYRSAFTVVDPAHPENSLILIKPLQTFEHIGVPGEYRHSHGGNVRWDAGKASAEYRTILEWLQGAHDTRPLAARR